MAVFTHFLLTAGVVGRMLNDAGIKFLYFLGGMSDVEKRKAVQDFKTQKDISVMVSSTF